MATTATTSVERPLEVGIFDTVEAAKRAIDGLQQAGFSQDEITVICSDQTKERYFKAFEHQEPAGTYDAKAVATGGAVGAVLAGLTVIASAVATGGLTILAAGPITAAAGGVAGGFIGLMMTRGVEKELANYYQQSVIQGRILVAVEDEGPRANERLTRAAKVFSRAGALPVALKEG
jgi:hypothetical protein